MKEKSIKMTEKQQNEFMSYAFQQSAQRTTYLIKLANRLSATSINEAKISGEPSISIPVYLPVKGLHFLSLIGDELFLTGK